MNTKLAITAAIVIGAIGGIAYGQVNLDGKTTVTRYIFMQVGGRDINTGQYLDNHYFLGRLPRYGEAVDMVFVGRDTDTGKLNFQLRVRQ